MKRILQVALSTLALAALLLIATFFTVLPGIFSDRANPISGPVPVVTERARRLHRTLNVVDLHADTLLWNRDLTVRSATGHADLPRLRQGRTSLQVFSVVTKSPHGLNFQRNGGDSDDITLLALAERWPPRTWNSLYQRARYQAQQLRQAIAADRNVLLIRTKADLDQLLLRRTHEPALIGLILALEGAHPIEGDLLHMDGLDEAGFRMAAPTHFFDNELAGSSTGLAKGGLTALGRQWLAQMERRHWLIDLAHTSPQTIRDVTAAVHGPVVISHTGVQATCPSPRNAGDDDLRAVAATGGVIGIAYFPEAVCGSGTEPIVRAIRHVAALVGIEHVALGSDFDGTVRVPFDAAHLEVLTQALIDGGFSDSQIRSITELNAERVIRQTLADF